MGAGPKSSSPYLFVTVGSTRFDALIDAVVGEDVAERVKQLGLSEIVVQHGSYQRVFPPGIRHFDYVKQSEFQHMMRGARLVISHAGAGTIMEALLLGVPIVVVVNERLMDNHQCELADALASRGMVTACTVATLLPALSAAALVARECACCVDHFVRELDDLFGD